MSNNDDTISLRNELLDGLEGDQCQAFTKNTDSEGNLKRCTARNLGGTGFCGTHKSRDYWLSRQGSCIPLEDVDPVETQPKRRVSFSELPEGSQPNPKRPTPSPFNLAGMVASNRQINLVEMAISPEVLLASKLSEWDEAAKLLFPATFTLCPSSTKPDSPEVAHLLALLLKKTFTCVSVQQGGVAYPFAHLTDREPPVTVPISALYNPNHDPTRATPLLQFEALYRLIVDSKADLLEATGIEETFLVEGLDEGSRPEHVALHLSEMFGEAAHASLPSMGTRVNSFFSFPRTLQALGYYQHLERGAVFELCEQAGLFDGGVFAVTARLQNHENESDLRVFLETFLETVEYLFLPETFYALQGPLFTDNLVVVAQGLRKFNTHHQELLRHNAGQQQVVTVPLQTPQAQGQPTQAHTQNRLATEFLNTLQTTASTTSLLGNTPTRGTAPTTERGANASAFQPSATRQMEVPSCTMVSTCT
jgi:hypothetical protein